MTAIVENAIAHLVSVQGYHVATDVVIDAIIGVMKNVREEIIIKRIVPSVNESGKRLRRRLKEVLIAVLDK